MHAGSINTAAAHHYNMDTDRSLLRHLLTAALVMFIICGFTVTPIAAAELAGVNERAYVANVVRECYPELTDKEIVESVDTAYQMLATEEFQTAVSESKEDIKRLAVNAIVNNPNSEEVAFVFSGFLKKTWYLVKSAVKQIATVWKKGHLSDLAVITTYILLNPAEKLSSPEAVDDTCKQLSQFVTVPVFEQMYQDEKLVLSAKIAWIIMLCCVVGIVIAFLFHIFDIVIANWLFLTLLVLFGLSATALLIIEIIDDVQRCMRTEQIPQPPQLSKSSRQAGPQQVLTN